MMNRSQQSFPRILPLLVSCALLSVFSTGPSFSVDLEDWLEIHGFGGWAYAETDSNRYLLGSSEGEAENVQFALNLKALPHEQLTIVAQINFESTLLTMGEEDVELDYAFAEWKFSDRFKVRFGRVKHPIGLYGETFDVGTIRPFYQLPQGLYGPQGVTAKAYNGIGLTGIILHDGWGFKYDLYGGEITGEIGSPGVFLGPELLFEPYVQADFEVTDVIGGKLDILTPMPGLVVGFSGYFGHQDSLFFSTFETFDYTTFGLHAEFLKDRWEIRSEWASYDQTSILQAESFYLEIARRFGEHWQIAARGDFWDATSSLEDLDVLFPGVGTLFETNDLGLALNYWFTPEFVARLEFHRIDGNRFAFPEDPEEILAFAAGGMLDDQTDMVLFGVQFSF